MTTRPQEIASSEYTIMTMKLEPTEETDTSDEDDNYRSLVPLPLSVELKECDNTATTTREDDAYSASVETKSTEETDVIDENEYSYNLICSSLKIEIKEDSEKLHDLKSYKMKSAYSLQNQDSISENICDNFQPDMKSTAEYEAGTNIEPSGFASHLSQRYFENQNHDKEAVNVGANVAGTSSRERKYSCQECLKSFFDKRTLTKHLRHHSDERFSCSECGKTFVMKYRLKEHVMIHTPVRPYPCKICDKAFVNRQCLISHMRTHTKERPYTCKECSKRFSERSTLKNHLATHLKELPYSCQQCAKSFKRLTQFKYHMNTHTGEKPYKCVQCGKSFHGSCNLLAHMKTHGEKKTLTCEHCKTLFSNNRSLRRHIQRKHSSDSVSNEPVTGSH